MQRPLKDKRPVGPFVSTSRSHGNTVLLTSDWFVEVEEAQTYNTVERKVNAVGNGYFNGEVADSRFEDSAVKDYDGNVTEGLRVVYDTQLNAVDYENVESFEKDLRLAKDVRAAFKNLTIVGADQ